jgi:hypothetical protein
MGNELFAASVLSLCRIGVCDLVVCTDSTAQGSGFAFVRQHVREVSGSTISTATSFVGDLPLFRLRPPVMRLEDELIDIVLARLTPTAGNEATAQDYSKRVFHLTNITNVSAGNPLTRIAEVELSDEGEESLNWLLPRYHSSGCSAETTPFKTGELRRVPGWRDPSKGRDFDMVTRCLRTLFPKANVTSTMVSPDVWAAPAASASCPVGTVRRAMQLATTKVVVGKQFEVNRSRLSTFLARNVDPKALRNVQANLLSVSGHVDLPGGSVLGGANSSKFATSGRKTALIDACAEFISVRVVDDYQFEHFVKADDLQTSRLLVCGALQSEEFDFLDNFFAQCYLQPLERRKAISYEDLSQTELIGIQDQHSHVELPGGCWFDGQSYLDMSGSHSRFRPDIRELAKTYIDKRNMQADMYNKMIAADMEGK